jgi:hypothetical protein
MPPTEKVTLPRMFSDKDGKCRFDTIDFPLSIKEYAPPAARVSVSSPVSFSTGVYVRMLPGWIGELHPSPRQQLIICLIGAVQFAGADGATFTLKSGESLVDENTTGPGHVSEIVS